MKPINNNKVKIKNLIGIVENPTYEDFLYEIVSFCNNEGIEEFKLKDVSLKTRIRITSELQNDVEELIVKGYLSKQKNDYKVIKHLWE